MSTAVAVVGLSGTGKSTSIGNLPELGIEGLDPKETMILNVKGKNLPFRGWKKHYNKANGNYGVTHDPGSLIAGMQQANNKPEVRNLVIDDAQYIMAEEYMAKAHISDWGKYTIMAQNMYNVINTGISLRDDLNVIFFFHSDEMKDGGLKIKTIGRMLDQTVTLEGLFTVVLYTDVKIENGKPTYSFITNSDGTYPAKSPVGMFDSLAINNDMGYVIKQIEKYNNDE